MILDILLLLAVTAWAALTILLNEGERKLRGK